MSEASIIGIDLAKRTFHVHGATAEVAVAFRKKVSREKLLAFIDGQPRCIVAWRRARRPTTGAALSRGWGIRCGCCRLTKGLT